VGWLLEAAGVLLLAAIVCVVVEFVIETWRGK
jgi:hypothetical protein